MVKNLHLVGVVISDVKELLLLFNDKGWIHFGKLHTAVIADKLASRKIGKMTKKQCADYQKYLNSLREK